MFRGYLRGRESPSALVELAIDGVHRCPRADERVLLLHADPDLVVPLGGRLDRAALPCAGTRLPRHATNWSPRDIDDTARSAVALSVTVVLTLLTLYFVGRDQGASSVF